MHENSITVASIKLVSCTGSSLEKSFEEAEDLFGGFGPDEWFRVLIPVLDPVASPLPGGRQSEYREHV